jgi:hypothetical protein
MLLIQLSRLRDLKSAFLDARHEAILVAVPKFIDRRYPLLNGFAILPKKPIPYWAVHTLSAFSNGALTGPATGPRATAGPTVSEHNRNVIVASGVESSQKKVRMRQIKCPTCKTTSVSLRAADVEVLRRRAESRTLEAWCYICDHSWPLPEEDQALIAENYQIG